MRDIDLSSPEVINTFFCYGDTRCISGDAFIGYQVRTKEGRKQNDKGGTLAHLFRRFHRLKTKGLGYYQRKQTIDSEFWCPSMTEGGRIFQNKIVDVIDSGVKVCVRVRTVGGMELTCTPDHPIADLTTLGFTAAGEMKPGHTILVHRHAWWTPEAEEKERVDRPDCCVKHHPIAPTKIVRNSSGEYEYKRLRRSRAVYEANMNGLTLDEYLVRLNDGRLDGLKFLTRDIDVHHKDENKLNDVPSNLEALSHGEHSREHFVLPNGRPRCGSYIAVEDVVSTIEIVGEHQTYDIKMTGPFHNFVADGFIVHNSGKTKFAATFPRPLFLSDVTERGWETISNMGDDEFFEHGVRPIVWGIEKMNDMAVALGSISGDGVAGRIDPLIASGRVKTIVVDSLTFYADLFLNGTIASQKQYDARGAYGQLGNHLRDLRVKTHNKNVNVVWLGLAKHPEAAQVDKEGNIISQAEPGGPLIPGQQADKFAAGVQCLWYFRKAYLGGEKNPPTFEIRTQPFGKYVAGNRLGTRSDALPNPLIGNYSTYLECIGVDPKTVRDALPVLDAGAIAPAAKPTAPPVRRVVAPTPKIVPVAKAT